HYDKYNNIVGYSTMPVSNPEFICKEVSQEEYELFMQKQNEELELQKELVELENWFKWYDNQVAQYNRCQRLGIEFDKDINELDNQAKTNQERIAQLRALINN
ncbi:MAG: hypothetical protein IKI95_02990, partial [Clostridia bacterium]|nr:hypothetical protein [Clostridia bacterium]